MIQVKQAEFIISNTDYKKCPPADKPEYAFIGRSNVGKSSLINKLTGRNSLAKVSSSPGKTQLINHFLIDKTWYLVDLPGYGYAKTAKTNREKWKKFVREYLQHRENLYCVFVLIDARHEPQKIDLEFISYLGTNAISLALIFTKIDKLSTNKLKHHLDHYKKVLNEQWEELPEIFETSAVSGKGMVDLLSYIRSINENN